MSRFGRSPGGESSGGESSLDDVSRDENSRDENSRSRANRPNEPFCDQNAGWAGSPDGVVGAASALPWPSSLQANAALTASDRSALGQVGAAGGALAESASKWARGSSSVLALREPPREVAKAWPKALPGLEKWQDPRIGWGLILPEREGLSPAELARADDAPEPIRELLARRPGSPVLRYRPQFDEAERHLFLRDWLNRTDIPLDRPPTGTAPGHLPLYLLIAASPEEVPWSFQFVLNASSCVGRLHFDGPEAEARLGRYVEHLLGPWSGGGGTVSSRAGRASPGAAGLRAEAPEGGLRIDQPVAWAVDRRHDDPRPSDITRLMRWALAEPVFEQWQQDSHLDPLFLDGRRGQATAERLARELARRRPGLVLTTSHGRTGPLADPSTMAARLGLPVDQDDVDVDPARLLGNWSPSGAMWVAWGCCTAGSSAESAYEGLFEAESVVGRVLRAVANLGDRIAPLPQALLGAREPLRAFVGQVEPTFDWTLRQSRSRARSTSPLVEGLYDRLYLFQPIGLALRGWYQALGGLAAARGKIEERVDSPESVARTLLYLRLATRDIESTVILGDPTVALPRLP